MKKAIKTALTDKMLKQEEILNQYGFSFQTKVFWNIVNDNWKVINDFKEVILSFGCSEGNALVYAVIVTNYHLNGATIKFNKKSTNRFSSQRLNKASYLLSNASIGEKFEAFKTFIMSVKTETFDKYLYCLNELRQMNYVEHKIPTVSEIKTAIKTKPQIKPHFKSIARLPKAKELTVQQIEQLLGYKIKIVA